MPDDDANARKLLLRQVAQATAGVDDVEMLMPHWDHGWWFGSGQAGTADALLQVECELEPKDWLREEPDDQDIPSTESTAHIAVARRSVEALYQYLDNVEGMEYVRRSGILAETIGATKLAVAQDLDKVYQFLEDVISQVLDDAWDSRDAALDPTPPPQVLHAIPPWPMPMGTST
ncbi:MAG: hypothetical protein OXS50_07935 [Gammaproteobacteria bacterium]|nr:hypothetical protein [Gammaproteobacteria bacterium]